MLGFEVTVFRSQFLIPTGALLLQRPEQKLIAAIEPWMLHMCQLIACRVDNHIDRDIYALDCFKSTLSLEIPQHTGVS